MTAPKRPGSNTGNQGGIFQEVGPQGRGFEPWVVNGELIAGLESPQDSMSDGELQSSPKRN